MSEGGALGYVEYKIQGIADDIEEALRKRGEYTALYRSFIAQLRKYAAVAHDLEWALSGDAPRSTAADAIKAVAGRGAALEQLVNDGHAIAKELREELENATSGLEFVKRNERRYIHGAKTTDIAGNHPR